MEKRTERSSVEKWRSGSGNKKSLRSYVGDSQKGMREDEERYRYEEDGDRAARGSGAHRRTNPSKPADRHEQRTGASKRVRFREE